MARTGTPTSNVLVSPERFQSAATRATSSTWPRRSRCSMRPAGVRPDRDGIRTKDGVRLSVLSRLRRTQCGSRPRRSSRKLCESIGVDVRLTFFDSSVFFNTDPNNVTIAIISTPTWKMYATGNRSPIRAAYMNVLDVRRDRPEGQQLERPEQGTLVQSGLRCVVPTVHAGDRSRQAPAVLHPDERSCWSTISRGDPAGPPGRHFRRQQYAGRGDAHALGRGSVEHQRLETCAAMKTGWLNNLKIGPS